MRRRPVSPGRAQSVRADGLRGARCRRSARRPVVAARPRRPAVQGKAEAPAGADLVGIDEAGAPGHGAPEVERGDRRPVRTVAQALVRDAPQRVAGLHGWVALAAVGSELRRRLQRRGARCRTWRVRRQARWHRRPSESARGAPMLVSASTPMAIRAAIRSRTDASRRAPTSPLRTCATTARTSWAQQAAQATQAATVSTHSASRGRVARRARGRPTGDRRPRRRARPGRP